MQTGNFAAQMMSAWPAGRLICFSAAMATETVTVDPGADGEMLHRCSCSLTIRHTTTHP
jgi:hypothetical protein